MNVPYNSSVVYGGIGKPAQHFQVKRKDRFLQCKNRVYLRVIIAMITM